VARKHKREAARTLRAKQRLAGGHADTAPMEEDDDFSLETISSGTVEFPSDDESHTQKEWAIMSQGARIQYAVSWGARALTKPLPAALRMDRKVSEVERKRRRSTASSLRPRAWGLQIILYSPSFSPPLFLFSV
jgi:hypothetical protein